MKKIFTLMIGIVLSLTILNAQEAPPQAFSFKALIKDSKGLPVILRTVSLRISILQVSANGPIVYCETFRQTTNLYAQVDLEIGRGTIVSGIFSSIDWAVGAYFLKVEVDPKGGTNYQVMSISQLLSVPYALYSGTAANSFSGNYSDLIGAPNLAMVATTGSYYDLSNLPPLFSGDFNDLLNKPLIFSGYYNDLINPPTLFDGTWGSLTGKPDFKAIAISGSWGDLTNTPVTLSGYGIADAMSVSHPSYAISADNISNWNIAAGWGNHAGLYRPVSYVPTWSDIIENPFLITSPLANQLLRFNSVSGKWENWIPDFLITEVDGSVTNEIQTLSISGSTITLSDGGSVTLPTLTGMFYYADRDNDDYGDAFSPVWVPSGVDPPRHFIPDNTDCNDNNSSVNPGATETPDNLDNNCDGLIDNYQCTQFDFFPITISGEFSATIDHFCFILPHIPLTGQCTINVEIGIVGPWIYIDVYAGNTLVASNDNLLVFEVEQGVEYKVILRNTPHNDGLYFGPYTVTVSYETIDLDNDGFSVAEGDCNDNDAAINPGATEVCDGKDNNCNGMVDEALIAPPGELCGTGVCMGLTKICNGAAGWIEPDYTSIPSYEVIETSCDGLDNDCDGEVDEGCAVIDSDGDGYTIAQGDCDDNNPTIHSGAMEIIGDGIDQDCDGADQTTLPLSFDWRSYKGSNWMTPVKNQGSCGSCFAVAAVAAFEAKIKIQSNRPDLVIDLSEQEYLSCGLLDFNCNGGSTPYVLNYIRDYGIVEESVFPYTSAFNSVPQCISLEGQKKYKIAEWETLPNIMDPNEIKKTLINKGPIIFYTYVDNILTSYVGGIILPTEGSVNKTMLLIGYNDTERYWIVENTWDSWWGEDGYYRLSYDATSYSMPYKYVINSVVSN